MSKSTEKLFDILDEAIEAIESGDFDISQDCMEDMVADITAAKSCLADETIVVGWYS
jgi:hypothetical protein